MKSIVEQVFENATYHPEKIALTDGKRNVSYRDLVKGVCAAELSLRQKYHLNKGDFIILAANKQISFVYLYLAAHLNGIIVAPIDPETNQDRFNVIYSKIRPKLIVGFNLPDERITQVAGFSDFDVMLESAPEGIVFPPMSNNADIIFTTGTTGQPKGVLLSQQNIAAAAQNINAFIQNNSDDVEMLALPISHSFGLGRLRCALSNCQTLVLLGSFVNMKRFFRFMEEYKVNGVAMVPASWAFVKKMSGMRLAEYASQLHYIEIGSAPMPLEDKHLLADNLPHTRVCMHYGLTEASRSAFIEFHEDAAHLDTVGKQTPGMKIAILDNLGNPCSLNVEGEICVKGDAVTKGYLNEPEINRVSFFGEYFRTGDWGSIDENGYISLRSRKKELINVGGKKVSPIEVEEALEQYETVKDCACIGVPDPEHVLGEVVKAFIVSDEKLDTFVDTIKTTLSTKLEAYKHPVMYEQVDEIPHTKSGKVQRLLLKK